MVDTLIEYRGRKLHSGVVYHECLSPAKEIDLIERVSCVGSDIDARDVNVAPYFVKLTLH